jgi:hypothetical protein
MTTRDMTAFEAAEDLYYGQSVCIWARWFVAATAMLLILWTSDSSGELARRICLVLGLVGINFYFQGRQMMDKPANGKLVTLASLLDLACIAGIIGFFGGANGYDSPYFILLYPVVFAFALVFDQRLTAVFVALAVGLYGLICLLDSPTIIMHSHSAKSLAERLITLAAMGAIGTFYWRIQRQRRRATIPAMTPNIDIAGSW